MKLTKSPIHLIIILVLLFYSCNASGNSQSELTVVETVEDTSISQVNDNIIEKTIAEDKQGQDTNKENPDQKTIGENQEQPVEMIDEESSDKIHVRFLEIGSVNCIPCKMMKPVMAKVEENYSSVNVLFYDINSDSGRTVAGKFNVRLIPTQIFLNEQDSVILRHEGFYSYEEISAFLDKYFEGTR